jgi:hypothetical protein
MPASTGVMKMITIHDADASVRVNRAANRRRAAIGLVISKRKSSERKNDDKAVTMPLKARKARKDRNSHERPRRSR